MIMPFVLTGQVRSGKNAMQVTQAGLHYPLPAFKRWREEMLRQIARLPDRIFKISEPCGIRIQYWASDHRRRDVPGMLDAIFHVLERAYLIKDDSLFIDVVWEMMGISKENPRVQISIAPRGISESQCAKK